MVHHMTDRPVPPQVLPEYYRNALVDRTRQTAVAAVTQHAAELGVTLPAAPVAGNPYRALRGTRAKQDAVLEQTYLPQALYEVLLRFGDAGLAAARALLEGDADG